MGTDDLKHLGYAKKCIAIGSHQVNGIHRQASQQSNIMGYLGVTL